MAKPRTTNEGPIERAMRAEGYVPLGEACRTAGLVMSTVTEYARRRKIKGELFRDCWWVLPSEVMALKPVIAKNREERMGHIHKQKSTAEGSSVTNPTFEVQGPGITADEIVRLAQIAAVRAVEAVMPELRQALADAVTALPDALASTAGQTALENAMLAALRKVGLAN